MRPDLGPSGSDRVRAEGYSAVFRSFDTPVMQSVRRAAYGEDIGQHSWTTVDEIRTIVDLLRLRPTSHVLDLGCGPGGPLAFVVGSVGCTGTGVDVSAAALSSARARAEALGVAERITLHEGDLGARLPLPDAACDAALSLDVVLHLPDRGALFRDVARVLRPGARLVFTDAGIVTGSVSSEEVRRRSAQGRTYLVPPGWNESQLMDARLRVVDVHDASTTLLTSARGRLAALVAHHRELVDLLGLEEFARQQEYLETVVALARRRALSRMLYVAERA